MVVAVVDGYSGAGEIARLLGAAGVESVHVASRAEVVGPFAGTLRPEDYALDVGHGEFNALVGRLREWGVDRVVAGAEGGIDLAARLGSVIGGEHDDPALSGTSVDKGALAQATGGAGLTIPLTTVVTDPAEAVRWAADHGLAEVVVKPATSAASDNVRVCRSSAEILAGCEAVFAACDIYGDRNVRAVVQERVLGREFAVNTVSGHGRCVAVEVWEYTKTLNDHGNPLYDRDVLRRRDSPGYLRVVEFAAAVLDVLGIRASPAHTEIIVRPDGEPVLIETCARIGGGSVHALDVELLGRSQLGVFVDLLLDPHSLDAAAGFTEPDLEIQKVNLANWSPGVTVAGWADRVRTLSTVRTVLDETTPGRELPATTSLLDSPGLVYLAHADPAAVEADARTLRSWERRGLYTA